MTKKLLFAATFLLLTVSISITAIAEESDSSVKQPPELKAYRINPHPPSIDGELNDAIWHSPDIETAGTFIQRDPDEGAAASESTLVAVAYDGAAMYVAFWCYDSEPDKIDRPLVRRDRWSQTDKVTLRIDPFHDHQSGNAFEVSAAGVQRDCRYYNEDNSDMSWDAVWESAVKQQPWGWSAEMRIPYHCLRFADKDEHTWGVDFIRYISRKNEQVRWAFTPVEDGGFVSNFGHLTGITGIEPAHHLEVLPYVVSKLESEPKSLGNPDGRDILGNSGFDLKYGLSSNLILDATVNPDFGQVELDEPVLNLSSYETYFSERRPFFMEGSDLFQTNFDLFYSRRIGRAPVMNVDDPAYAYYESYPEATTILGAAKFSGKLSGGTSIAFLGAVTQREKASYAALTNYVTDTVISAGTTVIDTVGADTVSREQAVEPRGFYSVLRLKQDLFGRSHIGGIVTLADRQDQQRAVTGGFDWRLRTNDGGWQTDGQVIFSSITDEDNGYGIDAGFNKLSGKHIRGAFGFTLKSPELYINHLGYTSRSDEKSTWAWLQYRTSDDWWIVRNSWNNFNFHSEWNYDGVNYSLGGNFNNHIEFTNFWTFGTGVTLQAEKYSDRETRGNGLWQWPVYPTVSWWVDVETDQRKKVSLDINPSIGSDRGGTWWTTYLGAEYRPRSNMEFGAGVLYARYSDATRWVTNDGDSALFADLDRDYMFLQASASFVVNRNLTCQLSAQGLISGLDYGNYRYYQGGNNYGDAQSGWNADYNYSALNSTLVVRWEYLPGSTMYLVWTRARSEYDPNNNNLDISRDFDRFFSSGAENVFLVKTSYWLNI